MKTATLAERLNIEPADWAILRSILDRLLGSAEVWAFGSRVRGNAREYSDLDLTVVTPEVLTLDLRAELEEELSESALPFKVDVVDLSSASEGFRREVERHHVVVQTASVRPLRG